MGTQKKSRKAKVRAGGPRKSHKAPSTTSIAQKKTIAKAPPASLSNKAPRCATALASTSGCTCQHTRWLNLQSSLVKVYLKNQPKYGWMENKKCVGRNCIHQDKTISHWPTDTDGNQLMYCRDCFFQEESNHLYCIPCYESNVLTNLGRTRGRRKHDDPLGSILVDDVADI